ESLQFPSNGAWKRIVPEGKRMNAVVRRHLLRQIFDLEPDHFSDRCLSAPAKLIHIRNDDGMENLFTRPRSVVGHAHDADVLDKGRTRVVRLEFFGIDVLAVCQHDNLFAAAGDGKISAGIDESEIAGTKPTIFNGISGLFRRAVITLHENGAADPHLSHSLFVRRIALYHVTPDG